MLSPNRLIAALTLIVLCLSAQGCWFTAGAAAGAAATEVLHDEGYEIDSPVEKQDDDD